MINRKNKITHHFYRWRGAAPFKLSYLIPRFDFSKNVQGESFNKSYTLQWINWAYTIWYTIYDDQEGNCSYNMLTNQYNVHELNVKKYL